MVQTLIKVPLNQWVSASWDEYIQIIEKPEYAKAKSYYYKGELKIEMSPLGNPHSKDHAIINLAITLFALLNNTPLNAHDNCTYRKKGYQEIQPDLSFYIGENVNAIPWDVTIINLDEYPLPDLIIEVSYATLADDIGKKRLLYEDLGVKEYWIIDVENTQIIAFAIENNGSRRLTQSQVLPGLNINILIEALQRTRITNHSEVGNWLLQQFQG
jgi:Uma2 family endonuclease